MNSPSSDNKRRQWHRPHRRLPLASFEPLDGQFHHPIPTSSRRHRSSSSLSSHIAPGSSTLAASISSIAPSRDTTHPASSVRPPGDCVRVGRSRASSITSLRQQQYNGESFRSASISSATRQDDASYQRAELEALRRENEMLRRRIQELEQSLRSYREGQTSRSAQSSGRDD